jgi:hypothetical protein
MVMYSNIVDLRIVEKSAIWSAQYFSHAKDDISAGLFPSVRLGDVAVERKQAVNPQSEPYSRYVYIGLENIKSNTRTLAMSNAKSGFDIRSTAKLFMAGDILYGKLRPNLNKVYLVDSSIPAGICSTEIITLIPKDGVLPEYLAEILLSDAVRDKAASLIRGASLPRVQPDDFLDIEIPMPDLSTQKELAAFIQLHRNKWLTYRAAVNSIPEYIQSSLRNRLSTGMPLSDFVMS